MTDPGSPYMFGIVFAVNIGRTTGRTGSGLTSTSRDGVSTPASSGTTSYIASALAVAQRPDTSRDMNASSNESRKTNIRTGEGETTTFPATHTLSLPQVQTLAQLAMKFHELETKCNVEFNRILQVLSLSTHAATGGGLGGERRATQHEPEVARSSNVATSVARRPIGATEGVRGDQTQRIPRFTDAFDPSKQHQRGILQGSEEPTRRNRGHGGGTNLKRPPNDSSMFDSMSTTGSSRKSRRSSYTSTASGSKRNRKKGDVVHDPESCGRDEDGASAAASVVSSCLPSDGDRANQRERTSTKASTNSSGKKRKKATSTSSSNKTAGEAAETKTVPCRVRGHGLTNHNPKVRNAGRNCCF